MLTKTHAISSKDYCLDLPALDLEAIHQTIADIVTDEADTKVAHRLMRYLAARLAHKAALDRLTIAAITLDGKFKRP